MADDKVKIEIEGDSSNFKKAASAAGTAVKDVVTKISELKASTVVAYAVIAKGISSIINGFKNLLGSAAALQDTQVQFEVLTGSVDKAKIALDQLQKFSAKTPFQFDDVASAGRILLSFGFAADDLTNKLQKIGDVAAASGSDLKEVAIIYGQVAAAGKLTGERLLQLQERGINVGPALAKTLGVAEKSIKDLVSKGKVDLSVFEKAFASLSEEGGFAFGGLDKQSKTLNGAISTMKDNWEQVSRTLGTYFIPVATEVVGWLTEIAQAANSLLSGPTDQDIAGGLVDRISELTNEINTLRNEQAGKDKEGFYFKGLEGDIKRRQAEVDALNKQLDEIAKKQLKGKEEAKPTDEVTKKLLEQENQYYLERGNLVDSFNAKRLESDAQTDEERLAIIQENMILEKEMKEVERADELAAKGQFLEASDAIDQIATDKYKRQLEARIKLDQGFSSQRIGIANQTAQLITTIFGNENKVAFLISKAAAVAQASVDYGKANMGALAASRTLPPIAAEAYYAQAQSLNSIQYGLSLATIGAATIKGFEDGGVIGGLKGASTGSDNRMATVRDGEMVLNARQQEQLFNAIQSGNLGGGGINVNVTVNDSRFKELVDIAIVENRATGRSSV